MATSMDKALADLDAALTAVANLIPSQGEVDHSLSNMRCFAGNDSRVLDRIPLVRAHQYAERALLPAVENMRGAMNHVKNTNDALRK